jgi:PD-(D/E)XK nuclease superfamily
VTNPTDIAALRLLETDERFQQLDRYVPPLALIRTMGVSRDEVAHSELLAMLLNPRRHAGAEAMLRTLLREIARAPSLDRQIIERLWAMVEAPWSRVSVHRERLFIDVVVEIASAEGALVVGIENKIDAGEQPEQIARYQGALARAYPDRTAVMIFLTPTGREPTTARVGGPVPALALGYDSVLAAVEEARRRAMHGSGDESVLGVVAAHLKEDILGDPEVKNLVRELWRTHGRALQLAIRHRPQLSDIREPYVELLRERYGEDAEFCYCPRAGR